jgi:alkylation response protein AidB-like acyl-CoA dehydrogenase
MESEVKPHDAKWQNQGFADKDVWKKGGSQGFLCATMPEQYGGSNCDRLFSMILIEEQARINNTSLGWSLHSDIVAPYFLNYGSSYLKEKYLPKMASGEYIGAIAMSEPAAGSDLQGIKTTAAKQGDKYSLNGSKTFITNGYNSDVVIVVCKTDPKKGAKGTSLLIVDTTMKGFSKVRRVCCSHHRC